jgi:peroxiredoxin
MSTRGLPFGLLALCALSAFAQETPKRPRQQARPGEVITRPDTRERVRSNLKAGDAAPEFSLPRVGADGEIALADYRGKKPVVLIFGTMSCPPYRRGVVDFRDLYESYKDRVEFLQVYIREAHPDSILYVVQDGKEVLQKIEQTTTVEARQANAEVCRTTLKLNFPAVADREDNKVSQAYGGWPNRLVIVDQDGKVAWISDARPSAFQAEPIADWLKQHVGPPAAKTAARP